MSTLYAKYLKEIKSWDWSEIVNDAKNNPVLNDDCGDDENSYTGMGYLGSSLNMVPSGKYYLPFACSNLDSCNQCQGTGLTKKTYTCEYCQGKGRRVFESFMNPVIKFKLDNETNKPSYDPIDNTFQCFSCHGTGKVNHTCSRCGGLGSHEAYRDQEYLQALDDVADLYGGYIQSGQGDPTDLYFCISVESPDNQEPCQRMEYTCSKCGQPITANIADDQHGLCDNCIESD